MDPDDEYQSWKRYAMCWQLADLEVVPADLWFADDHSPQAKEAAGICFQCPVRELCLKKACDSKEPEGIWGGLPLSIRHKKGRTHNFNRLKGLPNPYDTEDTASPYHPDNLEEGTDE